MKRTYNHTLKALSLLLTAGVLILAACRKEKEFSEDYDIPWPVPTITSIQPTTAEVGTEIRIIGTNLGKANRVVIGGNRREATVVNRTETELRIVVPRTTDAGPVMVETAYKKFTTSKEVFVPIYPATTVTNWPNIITRTLPFKIKGENMDLVTAVFFDNTRVPVDGASGSQTEISVPTQGLTLPDAVTLRIEARGEEVNATSPSIPVENYDPNTKFVAAPPIVLADFEDGTDIFVNGDIVPQHGINLSGIVKGRGQRYLTIREDNVPSPWGTNIGQINLTGPINLADFHEPHLSFLINTNGKQGYFQMEMSQGGNRDGGHFTGASSSDPSDNYVFAPTDGWEWRTIDLKNFAWEDWWGDGLINFDQQGIIDEITFVFKQGNGTNPFEINIDQIMITDGALKPKVVMWNFENGAVQFNANSGADNGINLSGIASISGNNYFTVQKGAVGSWDWTGAIQFNGPINLGDMECPFLNIWINTNGKRGYFQVETFQDGTKWGIGQTSQDYIFQTNGWQLVSLNLGEVAFQNWGGNGTEIDLKGVLEYLTIGFSTGNATMEDYEINIDDIILSDGPLF